MKKQKKRKKRHIEQEETEKNVSSNPAWDRVKERFARIDRRDVLKTGLWFLLLFSLYTVCSYFELTLHVYAYPIALGVLGGAYVFLNGGTFDRHATIDEDRFSPDLTKEQKRKIIEGFARRQKLARSLLAPLFGVMMTLLIDLIYISVVTA